MEWTRALWALRSRKVQVALATIVAACLAQVGWKANEETVLAIVAMGASLVLGIAHEDNGRNAAGDTPESD